MRSLSAREVKYLAPNHTAGQGQCCNFDPPQWLSTDCAGHYPLFFPVKTPPSALQRWGSSLWEGLPWVGWKGLPSVKQWTKAASPPSIHTSTTPNWSMTTSPAPLQACVHDLHSFAAALKTLSEFLLLCSSKWWKWLWILGLQSQGCPYTQTPTSWALETITLERISKHKLNAEVCFLHRGIGYCWLCKGCGKCLSWRQGWQEPGHAEGGLKPSKELSSPVFKEQGLLRRTGGRERQA